MCLLRGFIQQRDEKLYKNWVMRIARQMTNVKRLSSFLFFWKPLFLFQFYAVFRVLINLGEKNPTTTHQFQIVDARVKQNTSQPVFWVPGSFKISVGLHCQCQNNLTKQAAQLINAKIVLKYVLSSRFKS